MKIMAGIIALISLVLMILNWDTTLAVAWGVAFAGWVPHVFGDDQQEVTSGNQT
jgi:hypothetical protein